MTDKLLSIIGLARRAGRLSLGCDPVLTAVSKKQAKIIVTAQDISKNTLSRVMTAVEGSGIDIISLDHTKEQISLALGKLTAVFSVNDEGFAKQIILLSEQN